MLWGYINRKMTFLSCDYSNLCVKIFAVHCSICDMRLCKLVEMFVSNQLINHYSCILTKGSVIIHEVYEDGAAAKDGRLWAGDQIIAVS